MPKSPVALAKQVLRTAKASLSTCSSNYSRHDYYTQHQLLAILVLRQFLKTDYRGIIQMLEDFSGLREALGLKKVLHYSTLCYAEKRLLKKRAFESLLNAIFEQANAFDLLAPAVIQASKFVQFDLLVADAAYDGEHNHRLCREELGISKTVIQLNKRRSRK